MGWSRTLNPPRTFCLIETSGWAGSKPLISDVITLVYAGEVEKGHDENNRCYKHVGVGSGMYLRRNIRRFSK